MHNKTAGIGLIRATSLVIGNMIGSGIFLLPAALASYGGISMLGWILSGMGAISIAVSFSRLSRKFAATGSRMHIPGRGLVILRDSSWPGAIGFLSGAAMRGFEHSGYSMDLY